MPSKTYKTFVHDEELMYDTILKIIKKTLDEDKTDMIHTGIYKDSILYTIMRTQGLDLRDKVSGVIGELNTY